MALQFIASTLHYTVNIREESRAVTIRHTVNEKPSSWEKSDVTAQCGWLEMRGGTKLEGKEGMRAETHNSLRLCPTEDGCRAER